VETTSPASVEQELSSLKPAIDPLAGDRPATAPGVVRVSVVLTGILLANVVGVAVVTTISTLAFPAHEATRGGLAAVAALMTVYVGVVSVIGVRQALRTVERARRPLREDRGPTPEERRLALALPSDRMAWLFGYWVGAAAIFGVADITILGIDVRLMAGDVIATLLGGVTTCALAFLLIERASRPLLAVALEREPVERSAVLGIRTRLLLTWVLGSAIPLVAILVALARLASGEADRVRISALGITLASVALVAGCAIVIVSTRWVADPLERLRGAMRQIKEGDLNVAVTVDDAGELGFLQAGFNEMARGLRERELLRDLFGRHVGVDVARRALRATELGGEAREGERIVCRYHRLHCTR
jgi:adenylate cyclase